MNYILYSARDVCIYRLADRKSRRDASGTNSKPVSLIAKYAHGLYAGGAKRWD
jgi:hypothetical protein